MRGNNFVHVAQIFIKIIGLPNGCTGVFRSHQHQCIPFLPARVLHLNFGTRKVTLREARRAAGRAVSAWKRQTVKVQLLCTVPVLICAMQMKFDVQLGVAFTDSFVSIGGRELMTALIRNTLP